MIDSQLGRAAFQIGFYLFFVAGILLLVLDKGTPEYVITQFTFAVGLIFSVIVIILVRIGNRDGK